MNDSRPLQYLALGDSYTIGESVAAEDNFPHQLVKLAGEAGISIAAPRIIAVTGWTTDELAAGIETSGRETPFLPAYDLVSLLIGVNNQYRGRAVDDYAIEFEKLLQRAIDFAGGNRQKVVVLSIPDWGVTPFAADRDRATIAGEIDAYNRANRRIAEDAGIHYIYITDWTREAAHDPALIAADGLHPSAREYRRWAGKLLSYIKNF